MLTCVPVWLGLDWYFHMPDQSTGTALMSGFGKITIFDPQVYADTGDLYTNHELGFQVLKPSSAWEVHSIIEEMGVSELHNLQSRGFIDGMYVEKNHERQFMVAVFDLVVDDFDLESYIESQIGQAASHEKDEVKIKQVSASNDWAIFGIKHDAPQAHYGEQLLFLKDNRLYMILYYGEPPEELTKDEYFEHNQIMDSFEVV